MSCKVHGAIGGFEGAMAGVESGKDAAAPRNKGGRRSVHSTSDARKQRNRQAQAAFRERRSEYIKHLEEEIEKHEAKHRKLQAAHRSATDECMMMRYKNSLLERILLEKGIDVRAELQAKIDVPSMHSPPMPQSSVRHHMTAQRPRSIPKSVPTSRPSVDSTDLSTSSASPQSSPTSACSCNCKAHSQARPQSNHPVKSSPTQNPTIKGMHKTQRPCLPEATNRNGKRNNRHAFYPSTSRDDIQLGKLSPIPRPPQDHDTYTRPTGPIHDVDNSHYDISPPDAEMPPGSHGGCAQGLHPPLPKKQMLHSQHLPFSAAEDVPGFQSMTQMLQPYDFMLDMEAFGTFSYDSALTC